MSVKNRGVKISQEDNYKGNFGLVYRSSAIFYYKQGATFKTTISLMDYWKQKRNLKVMLVYSLRNMNGKLIDRRQIRFEDGNVINYSALSGENFEGSLEVEVFGSQNMVIPYSAIMAVYESENSISMVHSYGRVYSPHEIEEGRTITVGEESCWTIRDTETVQSFCVFHNGAEKQAVQEGKLEITNHKNEKRVYTFEIPQLNRYASLKVIPQEVIGNELNDFLEGESGNAAISYNLNGAFTRMLVGNETKSATEFQITHSNFNYSKHITDNAGTGSAFMHIPPASFKNYKIIIYPDASKGDYIVEKDNQGIANFKSGDRVELDANEGFIKISKKQGNLPSRIVTALTAEPAKETAVLPYECSLGIIHKQRPLKSTFWGLISTNERFRSRIFIVPMDSVYGANPDEELTIKIFTENRTEPLVYTLSKEELIESAGGLYIDDLFPALKGATDEGDFGYFYFRSKSYGGLMTYSSIESESGSLTLEHSF